MNPDSPTPPAGITAAQTPLAVGYGRAIDGIVPPLLIRIIGVMLLVLGSMGVLVYVVGLLVGGIPIFLPGSVLRLPYINRFVILYVGDFAAQVLAIWGGVLCLRTPLRGRRIVLLWAYAVLAASAYSFTAFELSFVGFSSPSIRSIPVLIARAKIVMSDVAFPLVCVFLFHSAGVRRIFAGASRTS